LSLQWFSDLFAVYYGYVSAHTNPEDSTCLLGRDGDDESLTHVLLSLDGPYKYTVLELSHTRGVNFTQMHTSYKVKHTPELE